jgi:hypothetical protein
VARYRAASEAGLVDRSSACRVLANRTDERRIEVIAALRRLHIDVKKLGRIVGGANNLLGTYT